jgi:hypothetical protein
VSVLKKTTLIPARAKHNALILETSLRSSTGTGAGVSRLSSVARVKKNAADTGIVQKVMFIFTTEKGPAVSTGYGYPT